MKKIFTLLALAISFNISSQTGNTSYGTNALSNNTGDYNTAFGYQSLENNSSGDYNTALGVSALRSITTGDANTGIGSFALYYNTQGLWNVGVGYYSLFANTGSGNTAVGFRSMMDNTTGGDNSAFGFHSLAHNTEGDYNTGVGRRALYSNTTGSDNVAVGDYALNNNLTGNYNVAIGRYAETSSNSSTNQTVIGYQATGQADNSVVLGNSDVTAVYMAEDSGATIYAGNATFNGDVVIQSDARLKSNIVSLGATLHKLLQIDGKSYEMKGRQKIGVLAQEIQEVFPELVTKDGDEMLAVNYQGLVPVLINGLKEQQKEIDELKELVQKLVNRK